MRRRHLDAVCPEQTVTLTATPTDGTFLRWELCPAPEGPVCRVPLTQTAAVCAVFVKTTPPADTSCPAAPITPPPPDTTRPNARITAGPSPIRPTRSRRASFRFASNESRSTFVCRLDAKPWLPCRSPKLYSRLKPGLHTFRVKAIDRAGNIDATPAVRRWRIRA